MVKCSKINFPGPTGPSNSKNAKGTGKILSLWRLTIAAFFVLRPPFGGDEEIPRPAAQTTGREIYGEGRNLFAYLSRQSVKEFFGFRVFRVEFQQLFQMDHGIFLASHGGQAAYHGNAHGAVVGLESQEVFQAG